MLDRRPVPTAGAAYRVRPPSDVEVATCRRKKKYATESTCQSWLDRVAENHPSQQRKNARPYLCRVCRCWHVTSSPVRR